MQHSSSKKISLHQAESRSRSVPVYPVILFVVAFLYLTGVMTWQIWKDHNYHQNLMSVMIKNRVTLIQNYFESQITSIERGLVEYHEKSFEDPNALDDFFLVLSEISPWLETTALVSPDGAVVRETGMPLTTKNGAKTNVMFEFDAKTPISGFRLLSDLEGYLFHRRKGNQGYLVVVLDLEWLKTLLARNENTHAAYELVDHTRNINVWTDILPVLPGSDKKSIWSVKLGDSSLELTGYINKAQTQGYYRNAMTPSVLVAFFYLFGGVVLIWYLGTARRENKSLQKQNRELAFRGDLILSSISDAVVVMGEDHRAMFANSAFCSLLKLDARDPIFEELDRHLGSDFLEKITAWSEQLLVGKPIEMDDELLIDSLPVARWVEPSHQMLSLDDGSQVVVWILKDVTEPHRIHEQLITSQNHYQSTFEGAGVALAMVDLNELGELFTSGKVDSIDAFSRWRDRNAWQFKSLIDGILITEVNESTCRLLDTIDDMTAVKHLKKVVFHPDSPVWKSVVSLMSQVNSHTEAIVDLISVSGRSISAQVTVNLVDSKDQQKDSGGTSSTCILLSLLDVSALKMAKEKAAEREQFWQQVVHTVPDVVYVNDFTSHRNIFVNHEIGLRLGYSPAELDSMGDRYWQALLHPEDKVLLKHELPKFRDMENGAVKETVLRLKHKNGKWHSYLFRDTPFTRDENDKVKRYIGVGRDLTELLEVRTKVNKHERYLEVLAENIRDLVWVMDQEFHFKYISPSIKHVLGYEPEDVLHKGVRTFLAEDQFTLIEREIAKPLRAVLSGEVNAGSYRDITGEHVVEVMALHQDGHYVSLEVKVGLLWDEDNNFEGLLGSCRDITRRRKSQAELKLAAEVFESSNEAILITDMDGDIVRSNRAFKVVSGYGSDEILGKNLAFLCTEQQTEQFYHTLLESVGRSGYWQGEVWHRKKSGKPFPAWVGISAITSDDGFVESYIVIFSDMSERKEAEERIHRLAYYDPLTDLANRSLFKEQLNQEMRRANDDHGAVALLYLDLDNFKPVNDSLGHEAGDILLKEVAQRLSSCVRSSDTVARMGGDEFTVILGGQSSELEARSFSEYVASQIVSALQEPISIQNQEFRVTASVGIAIYPVHGEDASELLRHADHAMYRAKAGGRDIYQFFMPS